MKKLFLTCFALFVAILSHAQDFDKAKLDSLFMLIEKNQAGMGSLSIFKNGKEVYQNAIGYADVENKRQADKNTKYRIGSISKMFTAVLTMQLVEDGKLGLGTKLAKFYPGLPNAEKITVENLLRHESGLINLTNSPDYFEYMESPKTKTELLEIFKKDSVVFEPGSKSEYSNTNYVLLTFIIEDVTGNDYPEVLEKNIVKPLGLENTYYGGKIDPAKNEALSYQKVYGWELATETDMSIPQGAGAVVSTPTDVNKFLVGLFKGELVGEIVLETMKPMGDRFGIGFFRFSIIGKNFFGHDGSIDGFANISFYCPNEKTVISYFSNGMEMPIQDIIYGVSSIYFGKEYGLPSFEPEYQVGPKVLQQYIGVYASPSFPLKITISVKDETLIAQATGQSSFPLKGYAENKFKFDPAGIKMEFLPERGEMKFEQGGMKLEFMRE